MTCRHRLMMRLWRLRWTSGSAIVAVLRGPMAQLRHAEVLTGGRHDTNGRGVRPSMWALYHAETHV